jgi:hypothetical protein
VFSSGHLAFWPSRAGAGISLTYASEERVFEVIRYCTTAMKWSGTDLEIEFARRKLAEARARDVKKDSALDVALTELEALIERAQVKWDSSDLLSSRYEVKPGGGFALKGTRVGTSEAHPHSD